VVSSALVGACSDQLRSLLATHGRRILGDTRDRVEAGHAGTPPPSGGRPSGPSGQAAIGAASRRRGPGTPEVRYADGATP
jgi:hypothetical protein